MKKLKILLVILVILLVLLVVAALVVGAHLGDLVKAGMEMAGPKVTQTTLTVEAVNVSLLGGSAGVKGFVLGNPEGYKSPQCITFSNAAVSLVPGSVLSDKIVIRSVEVRSAEITFQGNPIGANNLSKILDNVKSATGSRSPTATGSGTPSGTNAPAPPGEVGAGKKLQVDDFLITGAKVQAHLTGLVTKDITLPIPDIHFTNLGQGPEGITGAELTQKVLDQITAETIKTLASVATELGKEAVNAAKDAAQKAAQDAVNGALKNGGVATSNSVEQLKKGLNGLLGK